MCMNDQTHQETEKERKQKGTSPKDLNLSETEQDKIKGGTVEKQSKSVEKQ